MVEAVLHLHERLDDEGGQVLPVPDNVAIGMKVESRDGEIYEVARRESATDPQTRQIVKTWWECLPA